jgi:hypothetical protein
MFIGTLPPLVEFCICYPGIFEEESCCYEFYKAISLAMTEPAIPVPIICGYDPLV